MLASIFFGQMVKEKLKDNIDGALVSLINLTRGLCYNELTENYKYSIKPNQEMVDSHLDTDEISFHKRILAIKDRQLDKNETLNLLWFDNKVPLWINISVMQSTESTTMIELLTSRRLRGESDLNHKADKFPPFHIAVPLPPGLKDGEKFNTNWRIEKKKKGFWAVIKELVS